MGQNYVDAAHLFRRAGFGAIHEEVELYKNWAWGDLVELVLDTSRAPAPGPWPDLSDGISWYDKFRSMTYYWLDAAARPVDQAPAVEKMVLFFSGLLTSSLRKTDDFPGMMAQNDAFRRLGMGDYRTLLHTISVNSAMIRYLDNADNVKNRPNDNFARELMELFTLGVGNYSETDVIESARAWTGHVLDHHETKNYQFKSSQHDYGTKTFLGSTGNFNGPDIINLILDNKRNAHARFMCHKLWEFYAYPVDLNDQVITDIMPTYAAGLNMRDTLRAIFLHPQFRSAQARWALVRSPIEYLVASMRHTGTDCSVIRPEWWVSGLGQLPFDPPNVAGWGQNDYWLSSTAMWAKIQLANHLRWRTKRRGDLADVAEIVGYNPRQYRYTPAEAADRALWNYKLGPVQPASRDQLIRYVTTVRASDQYWSEQSGLLNLPLLLPEMQVA